MKHITLILAALLMATTVSARKPRTQTIVRGADTEVIDSLNRVIHNRQVIIDSLRAVMIARPAEEIRTERDSAQMAADSVAEMKRRLEPRTIAPTFNSNTLTVLDTLDSGHEAVKVILFGNNTWKYISDRKAQRDSTIFDKYWDTKSLFPYSSVGLAGIPEAVVIELVDSTHHYHYPYGPYKRPIGPKGKYGPRGGRPHQGVDMSLNVGDSIYAVFSGRVRISTYNTGGYGNLVIVRHDNGLETFYAHLSKRLVEPDQWVEAGQVIGLGGSTGRSSGPHLHFETRYYGQSFDPERLIDFSTGNLCRETFLLKKTYFSIYSNASQSFEDEEAYEAEIKRKEAERAAMKYHKIRSGDTLGALARKYGTTVNAICRLNGIKSTTTLRIGRTLRVR